MVPGVFGTNALIPSGRCFFIADPNHVYFVGFLYLPDDQGRHVEKEQVPKGPGLGIEVAEDIFSKFPYIPPGIEKKSLILSQGTI